MIALLCVTLVICIIMAVENSFYRVSACLYIQSMILWQICPSVFLSVYLSQSCWYCIEINVRIVKLFASSVRGMTDTGGWENFVIFDRDRHLCGKWYEIGPWLLWITNKKS